MLDKKTHVFCQALPIISQLLADKCGIKIRFGGNCPFTDGQNIVIPKVRCTSRQEEIDVLGSIIHEAGHIRFTDFSRQPVLNNDLELALINALEDPRIEKLMCQQFFGAYDYFEKSFKSSIEETLLKVIQKTDPNDLLCLYCLLRAHCELQGDKYTEKAFLAADRRMTKLAGARLKGMLDKLIDSEFPRCTNTKEIQKLAAKITKLMGAQSQQSQGQGQGQQSQDSQSQGQQGQGSQGRGQQSQGSQFQGQQGQGSQGRRQQSQGSQDQGQQSRGSQSRGQQSQDSQDQGQLGQGAQDRGQQSQGSQNQGAQDLGSSSQADGKAMPTDSSNDKSQSNGHSGDQPDQEAQEAWKQAVEGRIPVHCSWNSDEWFTKVCAPDPTVIKSGQLCVSNLVTTPLDLNNLFKRENRKLYADYGQALLDAARLESAGLSRALQKLLMKNQLRKVWLSRSGTQVNGSALSRLSVGNTKVFKHQHEVRGMSTAVHLLLDGSGSMGYQGFELGIKASLAIGKVLENMRGISWGLTLFQNVQPQVLIRHGETIKKNLGYLGSFRSEGSTPMYSALIAGGYQLYRCSEERKVLIVITDLEEIDFMCKSAVEDLGKSGILVVGIVVGQTARMRKVANSFPYACNINDMGQLKTALFDVATKIFS